MWRITKSNWESIANQDHFKNILRRQKKTFFVRHFIFDSLFCYYECTGFFAQKGSESYCAGRDRDYCTNSCTYYSKRRQFTKRTVVFCFNGAWLFRNKVVVNAPENKGVGKWGWQVATFIRVQPCISMYVALYWVFLVNCGLIWISVGEGTVWSVWIYPLLMYVKLKKCF